MLQGCGIPDPSLGYEVGTRSGKYYRFFDQTKTYEDAREFCQTIQGDLPMFSTDNEANDLMEKIRESLSILKKSHWVVCWTLDGLRMIAHTLDVMGQN